MKWLMGIIVFSLFLVAQVSFCYAGNVSLKWNANTEEDLAGYKIYYKTGSSGPLYNGTGATEGNSPIDVGNVTEFTVHNLTGGETYFFVATAYDTEVPSLESDYSNEVSATIEEEPPSDTTPPAIVTGFDIQNITPSPLLDSLIHCTFEEGDDGWAGAQDNTSFERDSTVAYVGQYSMRVFNPTGPNGELSIDIHPVDWNVDEYPFVRFAYKIPNGVPVGLFFDPVDGEWACLGGTGSHDHDGYLADDRYVLIDDNTWREITIDARDLRGLQTVESMYEFEWFTENNSQMGDEFWFDEFMILAE